MTTPVGFVPAQVRHRCSVGVHPRRSAPGAADKPRRYRLAALALVLGGIALAATDAKGEPNAAPGPPIASEIRVIHLAHAESLDVANAVQGLGLPINVSAVSRDTIIARGAPADLQLLVDQVINKVDVPATPAGSGARRTEFIALPQRPTPMLSNLLDAVLPGNSESRYGLDAANRLLAVTAAPDHIAAVRQLIKSLDRSPEPLNINFYFLRGTIGAAGASEPPKVPKELLPAAQALQASGFGAVALIAPSIVQVNDGARFGSNSELRYLAGNGGAGILALTIDGAAQVGADAKTVTLELRVKVSGRYGEDRPEKRDARLEAESSVTTSLDAFVILAAAPAATADSDAIAVVVRVSRSGGTSKP